MKKGPELLILQLPEFINQNKQAEKALAESIPSSGIQLQNLPGVAQSSQNSFHSSLQISLSSKQSPHNSLEDSLGKIVLDKNREPEVVENSDIDEV